MAGNRKNELKALFAGGLAPSEASRAPETKSAPEGQASPAAGEGAAVPRSASGAVKAMGLSLGAMTREAEEARALRQALNEGERVVTINPDKIDSSFIEDRLEVIGADDADLSELVESIREAGQQVPVLLRPHPEQPGRYQTAYGHRRIRAARMLGIDVKAIVRQLSDDELVLAQGKENAERRNLSFIERGLFAKNLLARGFDRKVIGDALAVQKSELSRLLAVVESIPEHVIRLIGPAPKAGRERWMKLGEMLKKKNADVFVQDEITYQRFYPADSDTRFQFIFERLRNRERIEPPKPEELKDAAGRIFARVQRGGRRPKIEFESHIDEEFIDRAAELLAERYAEFMTERSAAKS